MKNITDIAKKIFYGSLENRNITPESGDTVNKRKTAKGLPVLDHWYFGSAIILTKEKSDGRWSLVGGGIDTNEDPIDALSREIHEELGPKVQINKNKGIGKVHSEKQVHSIFAIQISGKISLDPKEIETIGFYPLDPKFEKERKGLERNMHFFAKKALQHFRNNHDYSKYEGSNIQGAKKYFDEFRARIRKILR